MDFEVDIDSKIKKMKECIDKDDPIPNNFVNILITAYEKQAKMIELMAKDLSTDSHSEDWIIDYYKKEAVNWKKMKKN